MSELIRSYRTGLSITTLASCASLPSSPESERPNVFIFVRWQTQKNFHVIDVRQWQYFNAGPHEKYICYIYLMWSSVRFVYHRQRWRFAMNWAIKRKPCYEWAHFGSPQLARWSLLLSDLQSKFLSEKLREAQMGGLTQQSCHLSAGEITARCTVSR